jgi:AcrR family transcriptional regulator
MSDHRDRILGCACDLYLSEGLDGFSMRKLAKQVGVTAPALYRHYESREHVLADIVREAHRTFSASLYRALEGRTALERLQRAGEGYLDFALGHPRWYHLLFISPEHIGMDALPDDIEAMGCGLHQFWVDRVRECMDERILKAGDPVQTSMTMWAHAHGLLSLYHHGHLQVDDAGFRALFKVSSAVMMIGVATVEFASQLADQYAEAPPAGVER